MIKSSLAAFITLGFSVSMGFAQEQKHVAFHTQDSSYVTKEPNGGLSAVAKSISGKQTFILLDLNAGDLEDGDQVNITTEAPPGGKPTYWRCSDGRVNRIGGKPDSQCVFTIIKKDSWIAIKTSEGKFVGAGMVEDSPQPHLGTTDVEGEALNLVLLDDAQATPATPAPAK